MTCVQFMKDRNGNPLSPRKEGRKKKYTVWFPPINKNRGRLFSDLRGDRKQARPSQVKKGNSANGTKTWGRMRCRFMRATEKMIMNFKIFRRMGLDRGLKYNKNGSGGGKILDDGDNDHNMLTWEKGSKQVYLLGGRSGRIWRRGGG